jgi:hypothetical protein
LDGQTRDPARIPRYERSPRNTKNMIVFSLTGIIYLPDIQLTIPITSKNIKAAKTKIGYIIYRILICKKTIKRITKSFTLSNILPFSFSSR